MITKPTLILDEEKCRKNIKRMFLKAKNSKVEFRPHFKTHQSLEIGRWFKELGVDKITVSSLEMAKYFSDEWNDITVAFPVNILEIETINNLAEKIRLNLLLESTDSVNFLEKNLKSEVGFFIKIDVGYHRTGISPDNTAKIDKILDIAKRSKLLNFKGFLTHAGQTYEARSKQEILKTHNQCIKFLLPLKQKYQKDFPNVKISVGDTPSCSVVEDFSMFDEIRPGNFVFYDLSQHQIGACEIDEIAVAMACPIVSIHKQRQELVIYGGGVHFSKERMDDEKFGTIFGKVVNKKGLAWSDLIPEMFIKNLSQEHGIVFLPENHFENYKIGDYLLILPVHSCMTADVMKSYCTTDSRIIARL